MYQGVLSSVYLVFKAMLSLPQPRDAQTMKGCPVVCLPDSPSDPGHFFSLVMKESLECARTFLLTSYMLVC